MIETDLDLGAGRRLHLYDTGGGDRRLAVVWHGGTPNIGRPPEPLFGTAERLGIRWIGYDRPGYGGSTPRPGRDVASAADDVARVADAVGIERFAVMGHSGGGSHALACGALLPDRVLAVVCGSGLAPYGAAGLDWFAGMADSGAASLRAATRGRAEKEAYEAGVGAEAVPGFTDADWAALDGSWSWFESVVGPAMAPGPAALIDDDLASVSPWGFDPAQVTPPVLVLHGTADRMVPAAHGEWLARHLPNAELRLVPGAGHVSVLDCAPAALEWLAERAG